MAQGQESAGEIHWRVGVCPECRGLVPVDWSGDDLVIDPHTVKVIDCGGDDLPADI